eukprot:g15537.t1
MASTQLESYVDGIDSGMTIVFVHGWPDDHKLFDNQVAHLKDRYRCVTTDLPGFGRQVAPKWGHSFEDITSRLEKTIEAVGNRKPVLLVGHDWGCLFAYMLEKKRPDLVHKLVALDIACSNVGRSSVGYVYFYFWKAFITGADVGPYTPRCPVLFMYGTTGSKRWVTFHAD